MHSSSQAESQADKLFLGSPAAQERAFFSWREEVMGDEMLQIPAELQ